MIALSLKSKLITSKPSRAAQAGSPEDSILHLCVKLCAILGLPKSVGLIYGAVFVSARTALRAVLGRLGTGVRTNNRYFIISKY